MDAAFATWGVPYVNRGACARGPTANDGVNEVGWGSLPPPDPGSTAFEAGLTSLSYKDCQLGCQAGEIGSIAEADITIESAPPPEFQSTRCLLGTLLHEVGHFLGLEHLPAPAIMQAETTGCILALTDGDRSALYDRYGALASAAGAAPSVPTGSTSRATEESAVAAFVSHQFSLLRAGNWREAYKTYTARFQAVCPYDKFAAIGESHLVDLAHVELTDITVRIDGDRAYVSYGYTRDSTPVASVQQSDPDVYVRIGGRWYDDLDTHTECR